MKRYIYNRVSSEAQDYAQQQECIRQYFDRVGISMNTIAATVVEKVSGTVDYGDRKLKPLMDKCEAGDIIYVSELSRLSRSMSDIFTLVDKLCKQGVTIIQCKDGTQIENTSIGGKAVMFALGLAAEIEVMNIRQRVRMGIDARKEELEVNGFWISHAGNVCDRFGNAPGYDMSKPIAVSAENRRQAKLDWQESSPAFKFAKRKYLEGWDTKRICDELNAMDAENPGMFRTREGAVITANILRQWKMCMGIPLPAKIIHDRETKKKRDRYKKLYEAYKERRNQKSVVDVVAV